MLTAATRHGLKITGIDKYQFLKKCVGFTCIITSSSVLSFVELVKYLFTLPDVTVFMSNRLCQDPLESFFGQQRQRGRVNENPNVLEFVRNTQALRVINTTCANIKGNCRGSQRSERVMDDLENKPIPKRRKSHHTQ